ncbi:hypothetical protein M8J76_005297 [Diaphorina citri]|nr:hypothetical protein M8J75_012829 [Diaphorina citri]KAI5732880.1 hypothetical protein M8J76_005297 [Diaphorina citri]KAI5738684.1 hypothetical protein M8J77_009883 [Diaphorina citri]
MDDLKDVEVDESKSVSTSAVCYEDKRLSYVGQDVTRIPLVLCKLYGSRVHTLDLSYNSLTSLTHLEYFPHLSELVLDNNHLGDYMVFPNLPNLHTLSLNKNNITDLEHLLLKIDTHFPNLRYLSLLGNSACPHQMTDSEKDEEDYQRYRYFVLYNLPQLQFLDSRKVKEDERREALRRGQYCKVAKPPAQHSGDEATLGYSRRTEDRNSYAPLPLNRKAPSEHHGMYGKNRIRYAGTHSEGNRFIRNNDL